MLNKALLHPKTDGILSPFLIIACLLTPLNAMLGGVAWLVFIMTTIPKFSGMPIISILTRTEQYLGILFLLLSLLTGLTTAQPLYHYAGLIAHYLIYFGILVIVLSHLQSEKGVIDLLKYLVVSGTLLAVVGLANHFLNWTVHWQWLQIPTFDRPYLFDMSLIHHPERARSFAMHHNVLGLFMALTLPLSTWWVIQTDKKWLPILAAIAQLLCLLVTYSRAAWVAVVLGMMPWMLQHWRQTLLASIPILLTGILSSEKWFQHMGHIFNPAYHSNQGRLRIWQSGLNMLQEHGLTGIGILNFESLYPFYQITGEPAAHLHNWYLQVAVESGWPAAIVFFVLLGSLIVNKNQEKLPHYQAIRYSLWILCLASLFDYTLTDLRVGLLVTVLLACSLSTRVRAANSVRDDPKYHPLNGQINGYPVGDREW